MSRKHLFVTALVTILVLTGLVIALESWASTPSAQGATLAQVGTATDPIRSITVVGEGRVNAKPDRAQINLGIETVAGTVQEASKENKTKMASILAALKKLGVAEKDIQTSNYSIYLERMPVMVESSGIQATEGESRYHVSNQVLVTLRDLDSAGDVIDTVVEAGANNVWGVNFTISDPKPLEAQARAAAIADAKAKAQDLAKLNEVIVGKVLTVSEVIGGSSVPMYESAKGLGGGGGTDIQPGQLEFTVRLQVTYAMQ